MMDDTIRSTAFTFNASDGSTVVYWANPRHTCEVSPPPPPGEEAKVHTNQSFPPNAAGQRAYAATWNRALRQLGRWIVIRYDAQRVWRLGCVAAAGILLSSCGVGDQANFDRGVDRLRADVRGIVDDTKREVAAQSDQNIAAVQKALSSHIPSQPWGQALPLSGTAPAGQARVGFALNGKIDNYGPGHRTVILRMCVVVTMTPAPELNTTITDTDCSTLPPKLDAIVKFTT